MVINLRRDTLNLAQQDKKIVTTAIVKVFSLNIAEVQPEHKPMLWSEIQNYPNKKSAEIARRTILSLK